MATKRKGKNQVNPNQLSDARLNAIIALLLIFVGEKGQKELIKKRRANIEIVKYLSDLGLTNKDLAVILNTTESGISNLRAKKK